MRIEMNEWSQSLFLYILTFPRSLHGKNIDRMVRLVASDDIFQLPTLLSPEFLFSGINS